MLADNLIKYAEDQLVHGDWVGDIQAHYHEVLPTTIGKQLAASTSSPSPATTITTTAIVTPAPSASLTHLHPTIQQVAGSLFTTNHYPQAIQSACTALEKAIQQKGGQSASTTGTILISKVFSKDNPLLSLSDDQGEREGYGFLYRGLLQAIRNHYAHNLTEIPAPRALEWLGFISALFYKLDEVDNATSPSIL